VPAVIPVHEEIRSALKAAAEQAIDLSGRLENVIAIRPRQPSSGFHGKADRSQPPWCAPVAGVILDLHAGARRMEAELRDELGLPSRARGSSTQNTYSALRAVAALAQGAGDEQVMLISGELERWLRRAAIALGEKEAPQRLPRLPGEAEPCCPLCQRRTLRMLPLEGVICCIVRSCRDENGRRLTARMEYSPFARDFVLQWSDMQEAA
jgi:hypothetical protein